MNIERKKAKRISKWLNGERAGPYKIEIRPTNQCNLDCIACKARGERYYNPEEELDKEQLLSIVEEGDKLGVESVHISGNTGEPLFEFEKTFSLMKKVKELDMRGGIVTNGTIFREGSIKKLVEMGWDEVTFSLDAPDAATHDYLRGEEGAFRKTLKNTKRFQFWKRELGKNKPEMTIATLISSESYDKIEEMLYLAKEVGASLFLQTLTIKNEEIGGELLLGDEEKKELKENFENISKVSEKLDVPTNLDVLDEYMIEESNDIEKVVEKDSKCGNEKSSIPCFLPWYFMEINANGTVEPCGTKPLREAESVKEKSLSEIWYGEKFQNFRSKLKGKEIPETCNICCGATIMTNKKLRKILDNQMD